MPPEAFYVHGCPEHNSVQVHSLALQNQNRHYSLFRNLDFIGKLKAGIFSLLFDCKGKLLQPKW
jgi:hypothetical protein